MMASTWGCIRHLNCGEHIKTIGNSKSGENKYCPQQNFTEIGKGKSTET